MDDEKSASSLLRSLAYVLDVACHVPSRMCILKSTHTHEHKPHARTHTHIQIHTERAFSSTISFIETSVRGLRRLMWTRPNNRSTGWQCVRVHVCIIYICINVLKEFTVPSLPSFIVSQLPLVIFVAYIYSFCRCCCFCCRCCYCCCYSVDLFVLGSATDARRDFMWIQS